MTLILHYIWQHPTANPLACGCDLAWLVTNPDYMDKIISYATCDNGTYLSELDPQLYIDMCFQ